MNIYVRVNVQQAGFCVFKKMGRKKGFKHSEKTRNTISKFLKGKHNSPKTQFKKGQQPSELARKNSRLSNTGKNNYFWKGENASYHAFHNWLHRNFGKANHCEHCGLNEILGGKKRWFDWALKKGFKHNHDRDNYLMLCRSCHRKYDYTNETGKKISLALKGRELSLEHKRKMSLRCKDNKYALGMKHTDEWKKQNSERMKGRIFSKESIEKMRKAAIIREKNKKIIKNLTISKAM